jgi:Lrp/AsnC family leucine-responsive transcriptional regulator
MRMKRAKIHSSRAAAAPDPGRIDEVDRRILRALTGNARATNVEIARQVGLSEAPCSRRIHRMEKEGVIRGYGVRLDPASVGVGVTAFITLPLDMVSAQSADRFADLVMESPHVLACYIVSGSAYALLHVAAPDIHAYSEFVLDRLRTIPGVKDLNSNFVMRIVKESGGLPELTHPARGRGGALPVKGV